MTHLTKESYRRLLGGELPAKEAGDLARHLDDDCPICERFLAEAPEADALDGRVDAALTALAPPGAGDASGAGNDLEFARIRRRVADAPARRMPRRAFGLAVAAGLLVAGFASLVVPRAGLETRQGWDGEKGRAGSAARAIPLRLRFLVIAPGDAMQKGVSGQSVPHDASLSFELELGRAAEVALVRVPAQGAPELVWKAALGAGRSELTVGGRPAAYPLSELQGRQRFALVAASGRLDEARALAAATGRAAAAGRDDGEDLGLSVDAVEVVVR